MVKAHKIKIDSCPGIKRVGTGAVWAAIGIGLLFVALWMIVAIGVIPYNIYWSAVLALAASAFGSLLTFMAYSIIRDGKRRFSLEINDSEAVLVVQDMMHNKKSVQMVLLKDIEYAEFYPYRDSATIIFHSSYTKMEVPLWPFGNQIEDVLDYLDGLGVRIIDVQSDEPLPEVNEVV